MHLDFIQQGQQCQYILYVSEYLKENLQNASGMCMDFTALVIFRCFYAYTIYTSLNNFPACCSPASRISLRALQPLLCFCHRMYSCPKKYLDTYSMLKHVWKSMTWCSLKCFIHIMNTLKKIFLNSDLENKSRSFIQPEIVMELKSWNSYM